MIKLDARSNKQRIRCRNTKDCLPDKELGMERTHHPNAQLKLVIKVTKPKQHKRHMHETCKYRTQKNDNQSLTHMYVLYFYLSFCKATAFCKPDESIDALKV